MAGGIRLRKRKRSSANWKRSGRQSKNRSTSSNSEPVRCSNTWRALSHHPPPSWQRKDEVMTTIAEANGTVKFDQSLTDTRTIWREAVTVVAERAKATL